MWWSPPARDDARVRTRALPARPGARRGAVPRVRGRGWLAVAVVAALADANFLLAGAVGSRLDLSVAVISELSAPGQPWAWLFRLGDGTAGVAAALLALPLLRGWGPGRVRLRGGGLLVFGVGTLASALVPLTCAASVQVCPSSSVGVEVLHDGVSVLGTTAAVVAALELAWSLRRRLPRPVPLLALLTAAAAAGTGAWEVFSFCRGGNGGGGPAQSVQVLAVSCWLLLEGVVVAGAGRRVPVRGPAPAVTDPGRVPAPPGGIGPAGGVLR